MQIYLLLVFFFFTCHADSNMVTNNSKTIIIECAIKLTLPSADAHISQEANEYSKRALEKVHECEYEEAIAIIVSGLERFPKNFTLQSYLAALLGDCSEITPEPLKDAMITRAKELFDTLLEELSCQPKETYYPFKNEYYYRFGMYREQYELGLMRVAEYWGTNEWHALGINGYYSQGVGASNYAAQLLLEGNRLSAHEYAHKAIIAWAQYFSYKNDYYNAYVHYAMALGILGNTEEMMRALQRSASLINRDLEYHEFKEVIDFIAKMNASY